MAGYLDMHCDTLLFSLKEGSGVIYNGDHMQSILQMKEAGQLGQFYAIFFPPREKFKEMPEDEEFYRILRENLLTEVGAHSDLIQMAYSAADIRENSRNGLSSAILTIEDGRIVNGSMERLQQLHADGVRAIALTWNFANCFGYPNSPDPEVMNRGLTDFGKEAVLEMNRLGMLVDVSHLSDGGFYDVARISTKPFVATHSNCRALSPHPRNLTDDMIRILAEKGGVSGLNFYSDFLNPDVTFKKSLVEDIVAHTVHFIKVGGEDCVGVGTDFDGISCECEVGHPTEMEVLFEALKKKGVTERQIDKISHENVMRVLDTLG